MNKVKSPLRLPQGGESHPGWELGKLTKLTTIPDSEKTISMTNVAYFERSAHFGNFINFK